MRAKLIDDQTEDEVIGGHQEGFSIDGVSKIGERPHEARFRLTRSNDLQITTAQANQRLSSPLSDPSE